MFNARIEIAMWLARTCLTCCFAVGGCGMDGGLVLLSELPAEVQFVVENGTRFTHAPDDSLLDLPPGTVIDDLGELDGCWGAALLGPAELSDNPVLAMYFVDVYDRDAGEYTSWFFQRDPFFGVLTALIGEAGEFSIEGDNGILLQPLREMELLSIAMGGTGQLETREVEALEPGEVVSPEVNAPLITLSGDRMSVRYVFTDREPTDPGDELVFHRFDCPE